MPQRVQAAHTQHRKWHANYICDRLKAKDPNIYATLACQPRRKPTAVPAAEMETHLKAHFGHRPDAPAAAAPAAAAAAAPAEAANVAQAAYCKQPQACHYMAG